MAKKLIVLLLAVLFELLNSVARQKKTRPTDEIDQPIQLFRQVSKVVETASLAIAPEFRRATDALERIATALEKLTIKNTDSSAETDQSADEVWITLPTTAFTRKISLQKAEIVPDKPVQPAITLIPSITPDCKDNSEIVLDAPAPPAIILSPKHPVLLKYLAERGITIREPKETPITLPNTIPSNEDQAQAKLRRLAVHLGYNFGICQELYKLLRGSIKSHTIINYQLTKTTTQENRILRHFCDLLETAGLIEEYSCQTAPEFTIQLRATGKEQNYLNGVWLEYFVNWRVAQIAQPAAVEPKKSYEALPNLHVTFKDDSKAELDLFFAVGQKVFCVEAKMRPSQADLKAYLNRIHQLGLDHSAILIVVADKSEEECLKLSQALGNLRITRLDKLEQVLGALLAA